MKTILLTTVSRKGYLYHDLAGLLFLLLVHPFLRLLDPIRALSHQFLHHLNRCRRSARFRREHLSALIHHEHATRRSLARRFTHTNRSNQRRGRIAQQRVWQSLLGFEIRVRLGAVVAQAVDVETGRGQRRVRVAEEAGLGRA